VETNVPELKRRIAEIRRAKWTFFREQVYLKAEKNRKRGINPINKV
jgi:hypothetical protein